MTIHHKIGLRYPGIAGVVLALLVALSGCHKEVGESGPTGESDGGARHVRIAASIDTYSLPGSRPSTRAAGTWEEVGSGIWKPQAELGLDYERAVYFAVLYIYPEEQLSPRPPGSTTPMLLQQAARASRGTNQALSQRSRTSRS